MNRRNFLTSTSVILGASALTACGVVTTTTTNGVTTITINVKQIDAWAQAYANAAILVADLPGIVATPTSLVIAGVAAMVKVDAAAFDNAANGSVTLTFDSTSVPAAVQSILTDGVTLLTNAKGALGLVPSTAIDTANEYINAVQTIVSLFQASLGMVPASAVMGAVPMSEAQALSVLNVK